MPALRRQCPSPARGRGSGLGMNRNEKLFDLKATIANCERWNKTKKGWWELSRFLVFFGLYCAILLSQINPGVIFGLDESLRQRVVDEDGQLQQVTVLEDLYTYLIQQIMPNVFPAQWYNNDSFSTNESGYILEYNKLVGGLLIVQERGTSLIPCRDPFFPGFRSAYEVCQIQGMNSEMLAPLNPEYPAHASPNQLQICSFPMFLFTEFSFFLSHLIIRVIAPAGLLSAMLLHNANPGHDP